MRLTLLLVSFIAFNHFLAAQETACAPSLQPGLHVVQAGETLFGIARTYKVSVDNIRKWNGLKPTETLQKCASLWVRQPAVAPDKIVQDKQPATAPTETAPAPVTHSTTEAKGKTVKTEQRKPLKAYVKQTGNVHVVQQGETIENIARLYGYTTERFRNFNGLNSSDNIFIGMQLRSSDCICPDGPAQGNYNTPPASYQYEQPVAVQTPSVSDQYSYQYDKGTYQNQGQAPPATTDAPVYQEQPATDPAQPAAYQYDTPAYELPDNYQKVKRQDGISDNSNFNNDWFEDRESASAKLNQVPKPDAAAPASIAPTSYLNREELQMIDEINLIRGNPAGYIPYVEAYIAYLRQNGDIGNSIRTAYELIDELRQTPRLSILQPAECVFRAALKHGADEKRRGTSGHEGSDGSWPWDRVLRECPQLRDGNENLVGGPSDIRRAVMLLLVDDGIEGRGHRKTLLDPNWNYLACHKVGQVGNMPNCWVQVFAN